MRISDYSRGGRNTLVNEIAVSISAPARQLLLHGYSPFDVTANAARPTRRPGATQTLIELSGTGKLTAMSASSLWARTGASREAQAAPHDAQVRAHEVPKACPSFDWMPFIGGKSLRQGSLLHCVYVIRSHFSL